MDFIDQLKQFSKRVESMKDSIQTEEATKTAIIMPFFSMLGYDVFNPQEFVPEFTADVGIWIHLTFQPVLTLCAHMLYYTQRR